MASPSIPPHRRPGLRGRHAQQPCTGMEELDRLFQRAGGRHDRSSRTRTRLRRPVRAPPLRRLLSYPTGLAVYKVTCTSPTAATTAFCAIRRPSRSTRNSHPGSIRRPAVVECRRPLTIPAVPPPRRACLFLPAIPACSPPALPSMAAETCRGHRPRQPPRVEFTLPMSPVEPPLLAPPSSWGSWISSACSRR